VEQGGDGAQQLDIGVVHVGEHVALVNGQHLELGAHPAVAHRILLHLGLVVPHGDPTDQSSRLPAAYKNHFLFLPLLTAEEPSHSSNRWGESRWGAASEWAGTEASRSGVAITSYRLQQGVGSEKIYIDDTKW